MLLYDHIFVVSTYHTFHSSFLFSLPSSPSHPTTLDSSIPHSQCISISLSVYLIIYLSFHLFFPFFSPSLLSSHVFSSPLLSSFSTPLQSILLFSSLLLFFLSSSFLSSHQVADADSSEYRFALSTAKGVLEELKFEGCAVVVYKPVRYC